MTAISVDVAAHGVRNASLQKIRRDVSFFKESTYKAPHYIHIVFAHPLFVRAHVCECMRACVGASVCAYVRARVCVFIYSYTYDVRICYSFLPAPWLCMCVRILTPYASHEDSLCVSVCVCERAHV